MKLKLFALSTLTLLSIGIAVAEDVVYLGKIKSELPKVMIDLPEIGYFAGVKRYELAAQSATDICSFVGSKNEAFHGLDAEKWVCHFEWDEGVSGLESAGDITSGIFNSTGDVDLGYTVSVYSGSTEQKVSVFTGTYRVAVQEPARPEIQHIEGNWIHHKKDGLEQINYDSKDELAGISVELKPQPYEQTIVFSDLSPCIVDEGDSVCEIIAPRESFGGIDNIQGEKPFLLDINASTDYFDETEKQFVVRWDYRPPTLAAIEWHVGSDIPASKQVSIESETVTVAQDEALIAIRSPHIDNVDETFWQLGDSSLYLTPSDGAEQSDTVTVDGRKIRLNIPNYSWKNEYKLTPESEERVGDLFVYRYDLSSLPDGKFDIKGSITDTYENGEELLLADNLFDRFPPEIKALFGSQELPYAGDVYFLSDLGAAASGGWDDGTKITSLSIGGHELTLDGGEPNIKHALEDSIDELVPGEEYEFFARAEDGSGNASERTVTMRYNPSKFMLSGKPDVLHQSVQRATLNVVQQSGRCSLASSAAVAQLISQDTRKGCTITWSEYPDGMETSFIGWTNSLTGAASDLGEHRIAYDVHFHSDNGKTIRVGGGEDTLNVVPSSDIELSLRPQTIISDGVVGRSFTSNAVGSYRLKTNPAAISVRQQVADASGVHNKSFGQLPFDYSYELSGSITDPQHERRPIWERVTLDVSASYDLAPSMVTTEQLEVIQLPDPYVNAYLKLGSDEINSTESVDVTLEIGKYNRADDRVEYDSDTMGEWNIYPAVKVDGVFKPLADALELSEQGGVTTTFDANELFSEGGALYSVADIISPHPEYTRQIVSLPHYVEVLKGTAVEGELDSRRVMGRTPFYSSIQFQFGSNEDREVATNMRWETSPDGSTWTESDLHHGSPYANFTLTEPQSLFVRLKVDNKTTGDTTVSETLELAAYTTARLGFEGPRQLYLGQDGEFTLTNYGEPIHESEGVAKWSIDGGETWVDGDVVQSLHLGSEARLVELRSRFRYNSTSDIVGESGWSEGVYYVQLVEPRLLTVAANVPSLAEAGTPIKLNGVARNPYANVPVDIVSQWTLPDGEVVSDPITEYTIAEGELDLNEQVNFTFAAWADGYKDETFVERTVTTRGWAYEFPELTMALNTSVSVAPSNIYGAVQQPFVFAPGVEFGYEWIVDESKARIEYQSGRSALIIAEESGMQKIQVRAYDNRGNEQVLAGYIDIVEPEEMNGAMKVYPSNPHYRAPLILNMSASAQPGHPRDYAVDFVWSLNGEVQSDQSRSVSRVEITEPGTYDVSVSITTMYGQVETFNEEILVVPNEQPVCEPILDNSDTFVVLKTNCTDADGRVIAYRWIWDGEEQGPYGTQIRFNKSQYPNLDVQFFAIDDSGGETQGDFSW